MLKGMRLLPRILAVACIFTICLVILESAARLLFPSPGKFFIWPPRLEETFIPDQKILPGTSVKAWFRTNSSGLRAYEPEPNDDYRILVLGGSATECLYLNQRQSWPRGLQSRLTQANPDFRIWVGNGGRSGQTSRDHIFHLEYLPLRQLDIDAVIIMLGVNDLLLRLRQDEFYDPDYLSRPGAEDKQIDHAFLMVPASYSIPPPPFYRRTGLWRALKRLKNRLRPPEPQDPRGKVVARWRQLRKQAGSIRESLPDLESAFNEYIENIERMIRFSSRKNIRLIFVTQPALWREDLNERQKAALWMGGVGEFKRVVGQPYYSSRALAAGLAAYNGVLRDYCRWRGAECYDLANGFPQQLKYFYDDCHFTLRGAKEVSARLTGYLLAHPPWYRPQLR